MIEIKIYGEAADVMAELRSLAGSVGGIANPQTAAAPKTRGTTKELAEAREVPGVKSNTTMLPEAPPTSPAPTTPAVAPATSAPSPTPPATVAAETSVDAAPVTQADLTAAANQAVATVGPGSAAKVQVYIREHFTQPDGTPGTLMKTAKEQWPALLADLQKIARKGLTL